MEEVHFIFKDALINTNTYLFSIISEIHVADILWCFFGHLKMDTCKNIILLYTSWSEYLCKN